MPNERVPPGPERRAFVRRMRDEGMTFRAIGLNLGISERQVRKDLEWEAPREVEHGEITARQERAIKLRSQGMTYAQIGVEMGITMSAAWCLVQRNPGRKMSKPFAPGIDADLHEEYAECLRAIAKHGAGGWDGARCARMAAKALAA